MALLAHAGTPDELVTELLVVAGGFMAWTASKGPARRESLGALPSRRHAAPGQAPSSWWRARSSSLRSS